MSHNPYAILRRSLWLWAALLPVYGLILGAATLGGRLLIDLALGAAAAYALGGIAFGGFLFVWLRRQHRETARSHGS